MELPDIDDERMKAASEALDKILKDGGTAEAARAEFERIIKGGGPTAADKVDVVHEVPAKPTRKPRSDKGSKRKAPPPRPEELPQPAPETEAKDCDPRSDAVVIGAMVIDLLAALKRSIGGTS